MELKNKVNNYYLYNRFFILEYNNGLSAYNKGL